MLLTLAGVRNAAIAEAYALSEECLQPLYDEWIAGAADDLERARIRRTNTSCATDMRIVLATVNIPALLHQHGLDEADVARVRSRLLD